MTRLPIFYVLLIITMSSFNAFSESFAQERDDALPKIGPEEKIRDNASAESREADEAPARPKNPLQMLLEGRQKPLSKGMKSWTNPGQAGKINEPAAKTPARPAPPQTPSKPAIDKPQPEPSTETEKALQEMMNKKSPDQAHPKTNKARPAPKREPFTPKRTWSLE
jgi:hypothetical protein